MEYSQDLNGTANNPVGGNVRCSRNDQFARSFDSAKPTHLRELGQKSNRLPDPRVYLDRSPWVVRLNVVEDGVAISDGQD